jgi:hypothetical protein
MEIIQKLFQKYRGATSPEAMLLRPLRSLLLDPTGRFSGRNFPDLNHPTGTRKHASKRCVVCMEKNDKVIQNTDAVTVTFHFVQHPVSAFITHLKGNK